MTHPTTADKGELLPCPFCGGTVKLERDNPLNLRWLWVGCKTCGISTTKSAYDYRVINAWNRRPTNEGQDGLTDSEILTDAHRYCCKYVHADDAPYRFTERGIIEFVRLRVERALNQRQAVKAEPAIQALAMIGEVLGLDDDDAGPTPIIEKIVCLQEAFETVKRLHLIATNQVVDLRKAAKPEPLSAAQGVPEETYVLFGYATGKFLERIVPPAQGKLINDAVALYAKADFSQMNAAAPADSKEGES